MGKRIAISSGDFNGIGPEVILKTLKKHESEDLTPIILSTPSVVDYYLQNLRFDLDYHVAKTADEIKDGQTNILEAYGSEDPEIAPGGFTTQSGKCAMLAVEQGITLCKKGVADALVTAPISKEAVNAAGYQIPGHTEFLAKKTDTKEFMMMLVSNHLRVGLTTVHMPLREVAQNISKASILKYLGIMNESLRHDFSIDKPEIAVLGLNPHAGDGGIIGTEEIDIITPALVEARSKNILVSGPHPGDGFFGNRKYENYDGILAMYHDQGLIPFKTLSFGSGVNFTAGLPIVRTSPDHGTAFDIAGKNKANPDSFEEAFSLAIELAKNREQKKTV